MYAATPSRHSLEASSFKRRLARIVRELTDLEADLIASDHRDSGQSLRTVIDDLGWQLEEMDDSIERGDRDE